MGRMVLAAVLMFVAHGALPQSENAVVRTFAGNTVRLLIPPGYCLIEKATPQGASIYALQEQLNQGLSVIGAIFVDCNDWSKRTENPSHPLRRYGSYTFPLTKGQERLTPEEFSREKFLQAIIEKESIEKGLRADASRDELNHALQLKLQEADNQTELAVGQTIFGLLAIDDHAAYAATGQSVNHPTESVRIVSVLAVTILNGIIVQTNLYAEDSRKAKGTFSRMLDEQKRNAARLVEKNR